MNEITRAQMAAVLNMPVRTLNYHVEHNGCPRVSTGKFDLVPVVHWYIEFLKTKAKRTQADETLLEADRRKAIAKATIAELDAAKRRGDIILISEHKQLISDMVLAARSHFRSLPAKMAPQLAHMDVVSIQTNLHEEIHSILTDLAKAGGVGSDGITKTAARVRGGRGRSVRRTKSTPTT